MPCLPSHKYTHHLHWPKQLTCTIQCLLPTQNAYFKHDWNNFNIRIKPPIYTPLNTAKCLAHKYTPPLHCEMSCLQSHKHTPPLHWSTQLIWTILCLPATLNANFKHEWSNFNTRKIKQKEENLGVTNNFMWCTRQTEFNWWAVLFFVTASAVMHLQNPEQSTVPPLIAE